MDWTDGRTHPDMKRLGKPADGMLQLGVVCRDAKFAEFKLTPVMSKFVSSVVRQRERARVCGGG